MEVKRFEVFAKMLSREQITLTIENVDTASVDLKRRHIRIPDWEVSDDTKKLFVSHEASHVIFTPLKYVDVILARPAKEQHIYGGILNVLEDCRIDKLMLERYPGLRIHYIKGSEQFVADDFFGLKKYEARGILVPFLDKVNVTFKTSFGDMPLLVFDFTDEEKVIIERIKKLKTFKEVKVLADELFLLYKDELTTLMDKITKEASSKDEEEQDDPQGKKKKKGGQGQNQKGTGGSPPTGRVNISEDMIQKVKSKGTAAGCLPSQSNLQQKLREKVALNVAVSYNETHHTVVVDPIDIRAVIVNPATGIKSFRYLNRKLDANKVYVNQFCGAFTRKQRAFEYEKVGEEKTGLLNMDRLHNYKIDEDVFLNDEILQNSKNHSFVVLIDCSGSMESIFADVSEQFVRFAAICRRLQVPYWGYGFNNHNSLTPVGKKFKNFSGESVALVDFYNSDDNKYKNSQKMEYLLETMRHKLGGTPLGDSLYYMNSVLGRFVQQHPTDILNLVVLSDGGDTTHRYARYIVDAQTRGMYVGGPSPRGVNDNVHAMFDLLRDKYKTRITYIDITETLEGLVDTKDHYTFAKERMLSKKNVGGATNLVVVKPSAITDSAVIKILTDCMA
jgi:hypothetical protein